jgi:hypothetical protein
MDMQITAYAKSMGGIWLTVLNRVREMTSKYFSKDEAHRKVGRRIRTKVNFADVPAGTIGRVDRVYHYQPTHNYGIDIVWERYSGDTLRDGFSKDEYNQFLEEL